MGRVLVLALPLLLLGVPLKFLPGAPGLSGLDQVMLPVLVVVVVLLLVMNESGNLPRRTLNLLLLLEAWAYLIGKLAFTLLSEPAGEQLETLVLLAPWLPVLLAAPTWVLPRPLAQRFLLPGVLFLGVMAALFALRPAAWAGGTLALSPALVLTEVVLASLVLVAGLGAGPQRAPVAAPQTWPDLPDHARDPLTGLPDARAMHSLLRKQALLSKQAREPGLAVAALRLVGLERLRTGSGEAELQALQAHVARVLTSRLRENDRVGRLGPDGFVLLLSVPDERVARSICERLRVHLAARPVAGIIPSVNIGVAFGSGGADPLEVLAQAEQALNALETEEGSQVRLASELGESGEDGEEAAD